MPSRFATACFRRPLSIACGVGLLLAGGSFSALGNDTLGQWRDYARRGVSPDFSWSSKGDARVPDVLSSYRGTSRVVERDRSWSASLANVRVGIVETGSDASSASPASPSGLLLRDRSVISSQFAASTIDRPVGEAGALSLTALVARQRYASAGFGSAPWAAREELVGLSGSLPGEQSSGHGVRLAYSVPVSGQVAWNMILQSKLDMDAFKSFRGVYSDAGDFDVPGRVESRLHWGVTPSSAVSVGVERVFYSEIDAFTSAALPTRFLSLLGDGNSPAFAWRDLTVYSLEGSVADAMGAEWSVRFTTRQQPSPTSALLQRALQSEYTDTNVALGYRRDLRELGSVWLAASYAPSRYFLGASPYSQRDLEGGSQVEFEALWAVPF
jgi:hypothetical protein